MKTIGKKHKTTKNVRGRKFLGGRNKRVQMVESKEIAGNISLSENTKISNLEMKIIVQKKFGRGRKRNT